MNTPITQEAFDASFDAFFGEDYERTDCERIVVVGKRELDLHITLQQARLIWQDYSKSRCAGWLVLEYNERGDNKIVDVVRRFVQQKA